MNGPIFLYLHGFASSVQSSKARAFQRWAEARELPLSVLDLRVPSFEHLLLSAMKARVTAAIDAAGGPKARAVLIGSSLGGLTACRVAEEDPRVCALFLMAPALRIASRWRERLGDAKWNAWRESGFLEVDDFATKQKARVHFGFVSELTRMEEESGPWPDVRVPARIVHGIRDEVVDVAFSREWAAGKRHIQLREVDDAHELTSSIPQILEEAEEFLKLYMGASKGA